ncbi:MAG: hypothetical protein QM730_09095 [Anaerolineales bacterium]
MRSDLGLLHKLYAGLLILYPKAFREEYGEELQSVFDLAMEDAAENGGFEVEKLILHELVSLPKAVFLEHLRERRRTKMKSIFAIRFDFAPGTRGEIWAALAPFLFFGALQTLLDYFNVSDLVPWWLVIVYAIVFWSIGLGLIVIGFIKRFPRWFMPYIGVPMPFISLLVFTVVIEKLQGVWWYRLPGLLSEFMQQGLLWMGMIFTLLLLLFAARSIPKSRPFYQRLREDWSLISFIVYGGVPLALWLTFDDYSYEEPFTFLALLILAAGGWLYLRNDEPMKRFYCLQGGVWLSMLVAAIAKALLMRVSFPYQGGVHWQTEFTSTMVMCLWLAMIMSIPLFMRGSKRGTESFPQPQANQ